MPDELLEVLNIAGLRFTGQIAERAFRLRFAQSGADYLANRLGPLLVLAVGGREAFIRIGNPLALRGFAGDEYISIVAGAAAAIRGWAGVRPARLETPAIARRTS